MVPACLDTAEVAGATLGQLTFFTLYPLQPQAMPLPLGSRPPRCYLAVDPVAPTLMYSVTLAGARGS